MLQTISKSNGSAGGLDMIMKATPRKEKTKITVLIISSDVKILGELKDKLKWVDRLFFSHSVRQLFDYVTKVTRFDSIISELTIPDANGFLVIPRIQEYFPTSPVIVIHDEFDEEIAGMSFGFGASDFLAPTSQVSEKSFERAIKLASIRNKYGPRSRNLLSRLDILSSRARELACGSRRDQESREGGERVTSGADKAESHI